jgi:hypothetical protein
MSCIHGVLQLKWKIKEIIPKYIDWVATSLHHRKCIKKTVISRYSLLELEKVTENVFTKTI